MKKREWRNTKKISKFDVILGTRTLISLIMSIISISFLILYIYFDVEFLCWVSAGVSIGIVIVLFVIPKTAKEIFLDNVGTVIELKCLSTKTSTQCYGTAIMIKKGILVTNAHVILDDDGEVCDDIQCAFVSKDFFNRAIREVEVVKYDEKMDVAILKIIPNGGESYDKIRIGSVSSLKSGNRIYAMGNSDANGVAISQGMVSLPLIKEEWKADTEEYFIQMTVATIVGNSGGAIFDSKGRLVGMDTYNKIKNPNFVYAIPIDRIMEYLEE